MKGKNTEPTALVARVVALEKIMDRLQRCPSVARELRIVEAADAQASIEQQQQRDREQRRERARLQRLARFDEYRAERLTVYAALSVPALYVATDYGQWCQRNQIPDAERMDADELGAALLSLPGVSEGDAANKLGNTQAGFVGVGLAPSSKSPADHLAGLELADADEATARAERRELRRAQAETERESVRIREWRDKGLAALAAAE
jgi:hypothetical protein